MCIRDSLWTISPRVRHERTGFVTPLSVLCGASWSEIGRGGQHVLSINWCPLQYLVGPMPGSTAASSNSRDVAALYHHHPPPTGFRSPPRRAPLDDQRGHTAGDRDPFGDLGQRFHLVSTIRA